MANRPRLSVSVKPKDGSGGRISLLAAWDRDGKLSAQLDRRIVELAVKLETGEIVRVKRGADGKPDHWVDVYENSGEQAPRSQPPRDERRATQRDAFEPSDDFGGDDLPF